MSRDDIQLENAALEYEESLPPYSLLHEREMQRLAAIQQEAHNAKIATQKTANQLEIAVKGFATIANQFPEARGQIIDILEEIEAAQ